MRIVVNIERVVLDGVPLADHRLMRTSLQSELERMISSGSIVEHVRQGTAVPSVRGGDIRVRRGMNSSEMGKAVAGAVHRGLENLR